LGAALLPLASRPAASQERGAIALGESVLGLGVNMRVLLVGAHPDDEDTFLIAWLSRGRHVETAYLSLTRGDGGQNVIGNELGEALGVLRTEELLAARRVDGARQYFTRAYDFGFSKDTTDTYRHWQKDSILGDVVRVVRAFRPHVIVGVFSGTPRDGHGQHQVSGILAREAYDAGADSGRFPVAGFGAPWTTSKFYRAARFNAGAGTVAMDVGEYSPLLGESYGEIAGRSRSQHKSQGFGALQRKGPLLNYLRREASRVNESAPANSERSMFDGIDTTWGRFRESVTDPGTRMLLDSLPGLFAAARHAFDPLAPEKLLAPLTRARQFLSSVCPPRPTNPCEHIERGPSGPVRRVLNADLAASVDNAGARVQNAMRLASGIAIEINSVENWPLNTGMPVLVYVYNRGRDTVAISGGMVSGMQPGASLTRYLAPGGVLRDTLIGRVDSLGQPWWLAGGRTGGMFALPATVRAENALGMYPSAWYAVDLGGRALGDVLTIGDRVVFLTVDDVKGELRRPVVGVPAIALSLDQQTQYAPAGTSIERAIQVQLTSAAADEKPREVRVSLVLPTGLTADSARRTVRMERYNDRRTVTFRVRGRLPAGVHAIAARAESEGAAFTTGYQLVDYDHIRPQRIYRPATMTISAVDARAVRGLRVGYVAGVSDNVAPALIQLGIPVTMIPAKDLPRANLSEYTTVVIGPRAYEAHPELIAANPRLLEFARKGGTLVVQYGQYEMMQPGIMPYPISIARPHDRVTREDAPVTLLDASAREVRSPNRIGDSDFAGWIQERALYMPRTFDDRYRALLSMSDPGEAPNRGGILVAPLGQGLYIYTTLAFFRQLPAGVPGAARLFLNLLSAGLTRPGATP
jgi:LmbE family N-acetylglucosaminyl deacetylase